MKSFSRLTIVLVFMCGLAVSCKFGAPTQGATLSVNSSSCKGCGKCVVVCNADAISLIDGKAVIDPTKCIKCGKCVSACPYDAVW